MSNEYQTLLIISEKNELNLAEQLALKHIAKYINTLEFELNKIDPELMRTLHKSRKDRKND